MAYMHQISLKSGKEMSKWLPVLGQGWSWGLHCVPGSPCGELCGGYLSHNPPCSPLKDILGFHVRNYMCQSSGWTQLLKAGLVSLASVLLSLIPAAWILPMSNFSINPEQNFCLLCGAGGVTVLDLFYDWALSFFLPVVMKVLGLQQSNFQSDCVRLKGD